jgi:hypothetical protein
VQCDSLKKAPAQIEAFAPSADQMRAHFESLVLATTTHSMKLPAAPFEESAPTARDRYVLLSSNALGAYLTVARLVRFRDVDSGHGT